MSFDTKVEEEKVGELIVELHYDESPTSPREWDNVGVMLCFHSGYELGDDHDYSTENFEGWDELKAQIEKDYEIVGPILPLYLYDHSGICLRAGHGFSNIDAAGWDWGIVGFTFATKETQEMTGVEDDKIVEALNQDVETYNEYLSGAVYGYVIVKPEQCDKGHTHHEVIESCWGFYGGSEYAMAEGKSIAEGMQEGTDNGS